MPSTSRRVSAFGTTIFSEINDLAAQHHAINLGQGKPDFDTPPAVIEAAVQALRSGQNNQYAPGLGTVALRQSLANHAARFYNLDIDPNTGVVVTAGATEAVFSSVMGVVDAGDEVIVIEPFFDSYVPSIVMAGAVPVYVPLHPPTWTFDPDELRRAFTPKTRALILNTPHNPTGRVFTSAELGLIAELCIEHDVIVISDEVYEHLVFDTAQHIPIASLPGMFERTITAGSMGKTFSATGWKIGWVYGHPDLTAAVMRARQFITYAANHPAQEAGAFGLNLPGTYFEELQAMYTAKRDLLLQGVTAAGLKAFVPEGTFYIMADFSAVFDGDDIEFAKFLTAEIGVACIPPSFFYSPEHAHMVRKQARFAFCKSDDLLKQAGEKLAKLSQR
ncbi:MAG TPA: aminotransferase class I/II-fold pyridoxal phosphate-dependent enzyme [Phototrophicaceae bacterium]|nr:aminotransferase class I/II-fold pyridoxal phosphate-dependent enzyme [Phototrophicaceae bacterium]